MKLKTNIRNKPNCAKLFFGKDSWNCSILARLIKKKRWKGKYHYTSCRYSDDNNWLQTTLCPSTWQIR